MPIKLFSIYTQVSFFILDVKMSRQPRPSVPIRPGPAPQSQRPHVFMRPSAPNLSIVPVIYAPSFAPTPFINYVQPSPRIFGHAPVFTAPPYVSRPQRNEILTPPPSIDRQSPQARIAPSPTLSSISTVSTDTDTVSKIKF